MTEVKAIAHVAFVAIHHSIDEFLLRPPVDGHGSPSQTHENAMSQPWVRFHLLAEGSKRIPDNTCFHERLLVNP